MRDYELMWILSGSVSDEDGDIFMGTVQELVTKSGGTVTSTEFWGRRSMAYPIENNREGAYYLAKFTSTPDKVQEIDHAIGLDQSVIRHIMVKDEIHKLGR